jgi:hypothetical protein
MTAISLPTAVRSSKPAVFATVKAVYRFVDSVFVGAAYEPTRTTNSQLDQIRVPR